MSRHAKIGASSMQRQLSCTGSLVSSEGLQSSDNEYAAAGTEYAKHMENCLRDLTMTGMCFYKGVDPETLESIKDFIDWLLRNVLMERWSLWQNRYVILVENYIGDDEFGGTPDLVVVDTVDKRIWIIDFKHGVQPVAAEENLQLATYLKLLWRNVTQLGVNIDQRDYTAEFVIYQPNGYAGDRLKQWYVEDGWYDEVDAEIDKLLAGELEDVWVEGSHCQFCPAKEHGTCPIKREIMTHGLTTIGSQVTTPSVRELTDEQLAFLVERGNELKNFIDDAKKHAKKRLEEGEVVSGLKLVQTLGNRKWRDKTETLVALQEDAYETKLISPAQAEKLGHNIDDLVDRPKNKTVVLSTDPRPSVEELAAVVDSDFEPIQEN